MLNLFYFYNTGQPCDLRTVSEDEYIGFDTPHRERMDLHTYGFIFRVRYDGRSKFEALQNLVLDALFMNDDEKEFLVDRFSRVQRCYSAFTRLARIYKVTRAKRFDLDCDLCTTPFDTLPQSVLTDIYDEDTRTVYRFRLSDIVTLSNRALTHAPDLFVEPLFVRNPYTNIPFTKSQLYHIYFALRASPLMMPSLFHLWFSVDFDLETFLLEHEPTLINTAIRDLARNGTTEDVTDHIHFMIKRHLDGVTIVDDYPPQLLVESLLPFLEDYLLAYFSLSPSLRGASRIRLCHGLDWFKKNSPFFGRKIYHSVTASYRDRLAAAASRSL